MATETCLIDTNVLLRWVQSGTLSYSVARSAVTHLRDTGCTLYYTSQNLGEFWNVLTRPVSANGYGLSPIEANERALEIETRLQILPDTIRVHQQWRRMLIARNISGIQVHDARLVTSMITHGIGSILTFNTKDFQRYTEIRAIHPQDL